VREFTGGVAELASAAKVCLIRLFQSVMTSARAVNGRANVERRMVERFQFMVGSVSYQHHQIKL
jgi:hypothetical protein